MASDWEAVTIISSIVLRTAAYVFLRWIPGHPIPPIVFGSLVTYLVCWKKALNRASRYRLVAEEVGTIAVDEKGHVVAEDVEVVEFDERGGVIAETETVLVEDDADEDEDEGEGEHQALVENGTPDGQGRSVARATAAPKQVNFFDDDVLIFGERPPHVLRALLTGLPSPTSTIWNVVVVLMHLIPAILVADFVYRAPMFYSSRDLSFAKVGYVSPTTANILVREPRAHELPVTVSVRQLGPISADSVVDRASLTSQYKEIASISVLGDDTDFVQTVEAKSLKPSYRYAWRTSSGHNGTFETAPKPGRFQPDGRKFTFLSSSCIKPRFPYHLFAHALSIPGFQYLAGTLDTLKPAFMLFLGDWIYVDVPRRMGEDKETYRKEYRQVYASPDWPAVATIPWLHVIDDHEIANDWDKNLTDPFPAAIDAYDIYQGSANPPAPAEMHGATWRTFTQGPASFFLMDTRQYRDDDFKADGPGKSMLGDVQLHSLLRWLEAPEADGVHWKVVVSSIPFTVNWRVNAQDTWAGFRHERRVLLEKMWDIGASPSGVGVVVLSGDRHEFAATSFPPPQGGKWPVSATVHEFSCSPLSMFYLPFRTYWEDNEKAVATGAEEDICIKYIPDGNSKFGAIEIEREVGGEQSRLHYRLFVDGKEKWSYGIMSPPRGRGPRGKDATWA